MTFTVEYGLTSTDFDATHVSLGEIITGAKVLKAGNGEYPLLSMTMHHGLIRQEDKFKKRVASRDLSQYKVVSHGQLVVGFPIDEGVLSFQMLVDVGIVSPAYGVWDLRNPDSVDRNYLEKYLRSPRALGYYLAKLRGSTARRRSLPREVFLAMPIPLPPIDEQRRIAAILDKANELRAKRRLVISHLDALTQSIFLTMFGDPASNPRGLPVSTLGLIGQWKSGGTPLRSEGAFFTGDIPWYTSGELNSKFLGATNEMITDEAIAQSSAKVIPSGSLLLGMYDTAALKSGISTMPSSCNQAIAYGLLDPRIAETDYVYQCIQTAKEHYRQLQRGVRQKNLNLSMIRDLEIPLPPLQDQREFGIKVAAIERIKERQLDQLQEFEAVFASLQHRAFSGEL